MSNEDILPGFDDLSCDSLVIALERVQELKTCLTMKLKGEIDTYSAPFFQRSAQKAIDAGFVHLVLVLDRVDYISSKAVGALIQIQQSARDRGGDLVMARVHPRVMGVFKVLSLENFFQCAPSPAGALALMQDTGEN
ncbi:MAG: STAS domain-containing protein [Spirochaetia bacterium]|jgi:anti-anti-sigma factor